MPKMTRSPKGLWVPECQGIQRPTRRDALRLGLGAACLALLPKPARATAWTFLRSTYVFQSIGASPFTIDTSDAVLAVACTNYDFASPYQFSLYEGAASAPNLFTFFGPTNQGTQHTRLQARILTTHSSSATFTWDTGGTGSGSAILLALFGVSSTTIPVASVQDNSASTPSQTTTADDTLVISVCGHWAGSVPPTAVDSGFTGLFGTHQTDCDIACLAYKIEPTAGAVNAPTWTITDFGPTGTLGAMFVPGAAPVSTVRHRVIG